ncbi:MAG: CehA/McbA family metallohydrolase [Bryobacteraceae bacterium]
MLPRLLTLLAGLLLVALALRDRFPGISAADSEDITWGATDPTWSPDGSRLAFSMFGSIWQVSPEGGEAVQVTNSSGYHAHPSWSPKGDLIAFVSGPPPAGRIPNISGQLKVVEVATGRERAVATPYPIAGTLTWSPDGSRLACGLLAPNAGSLLHEIPVDGGTVTPLQQRPQRNPVANWVDASWNRTADELFFATQRENAPQIWSIRTGRPPISVQLPLTRYRSEDIVKLHSLSALPSGSGVVYSGVVVNGKGDYELYRLGRQGGSPEAITNTTRDEFSPAVSPDGQRVAHVSNQLGNIDIFLMPVSGGEKTHVRISGLKFRSPSGRVRVKVLDETGAPSPARLYVRAADGKAYGPSGSPMFYYALEAGAPREGFFIAGGDDEFVAPAGTLRLTALKGVEYRILDRTVDVGAGETTTVTIQMERWTNWYQRGWYTGENHFHANYGGSYYQRPKQSLEWLEAEDLNTANMIVANAEGAFIHDKEFFRGAPDPISKPRYILYWNQEYRNSDPLGHMAFLNLKKQVPPSYTSVIGSNSPYDFPLNTMAALEARRQGGFVSYVHPIGGSMNDVFDTALGAKEAPVTAALGAMDAIDVLPYGDPAYQIWYSLLNSGFKILPGAGTDVFTNWRGINSIPGGSRQYVEVGSTMSWDRWLARYREGRVFVTNGPLVAFTINGQPPGSEIRVPADQPWSARLTAEFTSQTSLTVAEIIQNGRVIERREADGSAGSLRIEKDVSGDGSSWFAVRASGKPTRGVTGSVPRAHSGAIFVRAGDQPVLVREDLELMLRWIDRLWYSLEQRNNFGPGDNRARTRKMFDQALAHYRQKLERAN